MVYALQYVDSFTVSLSEISSLATSIASLSESHKNDNVRIETGTLRWRDGGLWIQVCLAVDTTDKSDGKDILAQTAVDTGLTQDYQTAVDNVNEVES
jgi:hypothetical protein